MVAPLTSVDALVDQIRRAAADSIQWDAIRGAAIDLDVRAQTQEQIAAVAKLKSVSDSISVLRATCAVERAFLDGKPGVDGWPRRF